VALIAALGVAVVGIYARDSNRGTVTADVKVDRRVVKAGQPVAYTRIALAPTFAKMPVDP
jgi:hypothetical protein